MRFCLHIIWISEDILAILENCQHSETHNGTFTLVSDKLNRTGREGKSTHKKVARCLEEQDQTLSDNKENRK